VIPASRAPNPPNEARFDPAPVALPWIVRLRNGVVAGEVALIAVFWLALRLSLPLAILGAVISLQALSNWLLPTVGAVYGRPDRPNSKARARSQTAPAVGAEAIVGSLFCFDTLCLTLILALTGGPSNPFSLLYLVQITFSAVVLRKTWTWTLGVLATLCFGLLFWISRDVPALQAHAAPGEFSLHLLGMWIAFATSALLISFFVGKASAEARRKDRELLVMQNRLARNERLASLATLAAGAAHEIATPLATIAVAAKEIEHSAERAAGDGRLIEDAQLIRSQVERCRSILERLGAQGADPAGEAPRPARFDELLAQVRDRFPDDRERIQIEVEGASTSCVVPRRAAVEALSALVKNALDASRAGKPVLLRAAAHHDRIRFLIRDAGEGMTREILERVSEPFFTTKPAGKGMGLGAFLAHQFAQRLGGELSFESQPGRGCTAILELPAQNNGRS